VNREDPNSLIGSILMGLGVLGFVLLVVSGMDALPFRWQRTIQGNAPMWCLGSAALVFFGIRQLWRAKEDEFPRWTPSLPGRRFQSVVVYTRSDCPLCEEALETLTRYHRWIPSPVEVQIDDDPDLEERYGQSVPVVEIDGKLRFRGDVNETLLRRLIEGTPPHPLLRQR